MAPRSRIVFVALLIACGAPSKPEVASAPLGAVTTKPAEASVSGPRQDVCPATARLLREGAPLRVEAYVTTGHPKLDAIALELHDLLERGARASGGKLSFEIIDKLTPDALETAKAAGLVETELVDDAARATEDPRPYAHGVNGLVLHYKTETETIKRLSPESIGGLEFWVASKVRELHDRADGKTHALGVLRGHGGPSLDDGLLPDNSGQKASIASVFQQHFPQFRFVDVDLARGTKEVDAALDGLLVLQPESDLADAELRAIDRFVVRGRSLAVVASAVDVAPSDATMRATLSTHGLERLTVGYGIELRRDALLDFERSFHVTIMAQSGVEDLTMPPLLDVRDARLDARSPVFFLLPQLGFPLASSLVIHPERQPGAALRVLARSTTKTASETTSPIALAPTTRWTAKGTLAEHAIAASVSGKLRSAFDPTVSAARPARVVVIASSQFFTNPLARAGNAPRDGKDPLSRLGGPGGDETLQQLAMPYAQEMLTETILAAKNLFDWMSYDDDLATCALAR